MSTPSATHQPILLPPIKQKSDSHCGPATIQLLYSFVNQSFSQDTITKAAGISRRIRKEGSRPFELAKAVSVLTPDLKFWFKARATREDLHQMICVNRWPVGVNWQGLYYDKPEDERAAELDRLPGYNGHYSVIIDLDLDQDRIVIADPYYEFSDQPRQLSLSWFESRWWDRVQDQDPETKEISFTTTNKLMFILAKETELPKEVELRPAEELSVLTF